MSRARHIDHALRRATARDKKRVPRMKVSGTSVFGLQKLLRKKR